MELSLVAGSSPTSCFYPSKGCGEAHPNGLGYQRFLKSANLFDGGWIERVMEDKASTEFADGIALESLWSLSFSAGSMNGLFCEFQKLLKMAGPNLGRLSPT
jgi:hypothetical protein